MAAAAATAADGGDRGGGGTTTVSGGGGTRRRSCPSPPPPPPMVAAVAVSLMGVLKGVRATAATAAARWIRLPAKPVLAVLLTDPSPVEAGGSERKRSLGERGKWSTWRWRRWRRSEGGGGGGGGRSGPQRRHTPQEQHAWAVHTPRVPPPMGAPPASWGPGATRGRPRNASEGARLAHVCMSCTYVTVPYCTYLHTYPLPSRRPQSPLPPLIGHRHPALAIR